MTNYEKVKEELTLSGEERSQMRAALLERINTTAARPVPSPFVFHMTYVRYSAAFALAVLFIGGGSVSALAEGALPGDVLYGVKVGVNERFERATAFSSSARAQVEIRHAEERLREVQLLVAEGTEDIRSLETVSEEVGAHITRTEEALRELKEAGNDEQADRIATALSSTLVAHADILRAQAQGEEESERDRLTALSVAVSASVEEDEAQDDNNTAQLSLARKASIEERLATLREELKKGKVSSTTEAELAAELVSIEMALKETDMLSVEESVGMYEELALRAYRAEALLTSARRISDKTGKDVYIRFSNRGKGKAKEEAREVSPPATTSLMMTAAGSAPVVEADKEELEFEFRVEDEDEDEEEDEDRSGKGGGDD